MSECPGGFSVQEVAVLLTAVCAAAVTLATPLFRALMAQNRELLDIQRDQVGILREQVDALAKTELAARRPRPR